MTQKLVSPGVCCLSRALSSSGGSHQAPLCSARRERDAAACPACSVREATTADQPPPAGAGGAAGSAGPRRAPPPPPQAPPDRGEEQATGGKSAFGMSLLHAAPPFGGSVFWVPWQVCPRAAPRAVRGPVAGVTVLSCANSWEFLNSTPTPPSNGEENAAMTLLDQKGCI